MNMQRSKRLVSEAQLNAVLQADCLAVMRYFRSCSAEFVLTHPPYLVHCRSMPTSGSTDPRPRIRGRAFTFWSPFGRRRTPS